MADTFVHVHVTSTLGDGKPDSTAVAFFYDTQNQPLASKAADANGDIEFEMPNGAVTVLQKAASERLSTFHGVAAGDHLRAGTPYDPSLMTTAMPHPMTIALPSDATDAAVLFECGGATSTSSDPLTIEFYDACETPTFDVLATHQPSGQPLEWLWQPGVAFLEHGQFTLDDDFAPVAMTSTTISNIPANLTRVVPKTFTVVGGMRIGFDQLDLETPQPGDQTVAMRYPGTAGNASIVDVEEVRLAEPLDEHAVVTLGSPANISIDLDELPLPTLDVKAHATNTGVTWTESGTQHGDARFVLWTGMKDGVNVVWTSVEDPTTAGPSTLIPLPQSYATDDPTSNGTTVNALDSEVMYVDYSNLNGYADARPYGVALANPQATFLDVEHRAHFVQSP